MINKNGKMQFHKELLDKHTLCNSVTIHSTYLIFRAAEKYSISRTLFFEQILPHFSHFDRAPFKINNQNFCSRYFDGYLPKTLQPFLNAC